MLRAGPVTGLGSAAVAVRFNRARGEADTWLMSRRRVPLLRRVVVAMVAVILVVGGLTVVRRALDEPGVEMELKALSATRSWPLVLP